MVVSNTFLDYPDNESHAIIVYFTGCDFSCKDCHNAENKLYREKEKSPKELYSLLLEESKKLGNTNTLVLSGGDPLSSFNKKYTLSFLKINSFFDICIYTGNVEVPKELKLLNDKWSYIKLGQYESDKKQEAKKTDTYFQLASTNQKLVNNKLETISKEGRYYFNV